MRYFVPELVAEADGPERLGGVPWGLAAAAWPRCGTCGGLQSLLAQFVHHPERIDLGREGRVLLVFQCGHHPGMCETWDAFSGANACIVVEPEEVGDAPTPEPEEWTPVDNGAAIAGWAARDDGLTPEEAAAFGADATFFALDEGVLAKATWSTRLGGVPMWVQSPDEAPRPGWRFLGQLDSSLSFLRAPEPLPLWVHADAERYEGRTHSGEGPNLGDGGIAYLYLEEAGEPPRVVMFWQCG